MHKAAVVHAQDLHVTVDKLTVHAGAETPYFCQEQVSEHFKIAAPVEGNPLIARCVQSSIVIVTLHGMGSAE
jgi:hypothetical protein